MATPLSKLPRRLARALGIGLLAALLQACGPGVVGTGTGEGLDTFGATASSLCSSDIAAALACPAGTAVPPASAPPGAEAGTALVHFADTIDGRRVAVAVQGNTIEINAPCARINLRAQWATVPGQPPRFYGYNQGDRQQPVQVRAVLAGGGLQLTVFNAAGDTLLGPVLVAPRSGAAAPDAC